MKAGEAGLTRDAFLGGRLQILQPERGFRSSTDAILLAAAVPARPGQRVLDLGCGAGAAALALGVRVPGLDLHGIELQPGYAALARRNAAANGVPLTVHEGDLGAMPDTLRAMAFDHVLSNPPFFPPEAPPAADPGRDIAQREAMPVARWVGAGLRRLRPDGTLTLIHLASRLPAILAALDGPAGAIAVLPLQPREGRDSRRVVVRGVKGSRGPFRLLPPLVLHQGERHPGDHDHFTEIADRILRDGLALPLGNQG